MRALFLMLKKTELRLLYSFYKKYYYIVSWNFISIKTIEEVSDVNTLFDYKKLKFCRRLYLLKNIISK